MHRKINQLKSLLGVVALGLVATNAFGATTNLNCTFASGNADSGGVRVVLDDSANTAVAGDDPVSPATFTDATVTWGKVETRDSYRQYNKFYKFNRDTGVLTLSGAEKPENETQWTLLKGIYRCAAAKK